MLKDTNGALKDNLARKAENLYRTRQHLCADAVLLAFNDGLGGGLTEQQAVGLTSGMSIGQGESGCLCGAVGGGALVLGLFLADGNAYRNSGKVREAVKDLHERFKAVHKSTCCRVLTKKVKDDDAAHFEQCAKFTGNAAHMVADILLERRPELVGRVDPEYVTRRDSLGRGLMRHLFNRLFH